MENTELKKKDERQKRLDMKERLDRAMAQNILTLDNMLAIPPTATSSEHHQTLVRHLAPKSGEAALRSYNAL